MDLDFGLIWNIISTIIAVGMFGWDIWNKAQIDKEKSIHKAQVKIWQHFASGINHGIMGIANDIEYKKISSSEQILNAIKPLQPVSYSLYASLNEERLFSDEEVKAKQLENDKKIQELFVPKG